MRKRSTTLITAVCCTLSTLSAYGVQPGEGVVLDPATLNYTVTYCDPDKLPESCQLEQVVFVPSTKIDPSVRSQFSLDASTGGIRYRYDIRLKTTSRQSLVQIVLDPVSSVSGLPQPKTVSGINQQSVSDVTAVAAGISTPTGWQGDALPSTVSLGWRIAWTFGNISGPSAGLAPGKMVSGFSIVSQDLPGIVLGALSGNPEKITSFDDDGPVGDVGAQLHALEKHDFVSSALVVPAISVPAPFDRAELLRRIDTQIATWVGLGLLDTTTLSQIEGFVQEAISAASRNDLKSYGEHIGNVEKLIHGIYESLEETNDGAEEKPGSPLLSRLAAQVLEFDLKYALHRS